LPQAYAAVLSVAGTPRLLASSVLARMPLGMTSLAILLLVRDRTGSFRSAGLVVGVFALSQAAASPVQGALVDRLGQRRTLLPGALAQAAFLVALVFVAHAGAGAAVLALLAAPAGALLPPVGASLRALWPAVAPEGHREAAYSLDAVTQETIWTLGPLAVGAVVAADSPAAAVLLCATITVVGTATFVTAPLASRAHPPRHARPPGGALASPGLRRLLVTAALMGIGIGAVEVGLPALAFHVGAGGSAGLLLAVWSLGSMVGGLWYGTRRWRGRAEVRYRWLLVAIALVAAPLLAARSMSAAVILGTIAGLGFAPTMACQMGLIGELARPGTVTEAFTWSTAAIGGGIAGGSALAGVLTESAGAVAPFVVGCAAPALAAALAFSSRGRSARRVPAHPSESPAAD
jgi:MFS family permease